MDIILSLKGVHRDGFNATAKGFMTTPKEVAMQSK